MSEPVSTSVFPVSREGGAGLSRGVTRGRGFVAPSRGVRIRLQDADDVDVRRRAALLGCRPDAVLVDVSAARAWGLPVPPWMANEHRPEAVAVPRGRARPRRPDVAGRRVELPDDHVVSLDDLRVTTPARTWVDCARRIPFEHLVAMGDALLRRELGTPAELRDMVHWARGRRGVRSARLGIPLLNPRAESPGESLTRVMLLRGGLPPPSVNPEIVERGEWLARVDLAWRDERVIVEYDGAVHLDERQRRRDARRRNLLQEAGWTVIVLTADDLRHPEATCALVRAALNRSRGA